MTHTRHGPIDLACAPLAQIPSRTAVSNAYAALGRNVMDAAAREAIHRATGGNVNLGHWTECFAGRMVADAIARGRQGRPAWLYAVNVRDAVNYLHFNSDLQATYIVKPDSWFLKHHQQSRDKIALVYSGLVPVFSLPTTLTPGLGAALVPCHGGCLGILAADPGLFLHGTVQEHEAQMAMAGPLYVVPEIGTELSGFLHSEQWLRSGGEPNPGPQGDDPIDRHQRKLHARAVEKMKRQRRERREREAAKLALQRAGIHPNPGPKNRRHTCPQCGLTYVGNPTSHAECHSDATKTGRFIISDREGESEIVATLEVARVMHESSRPRALVDAVQLGLVDDVEEAQRAEDSFAELPLLRRPRESLSADVRIEALAQKADELRAEGKPRAARSYDAQRIMQRWAASDARLAKLAPGPASDASLAPRTILSMPRQSLTLLSAATFLQPGLGEYLMRIEDERASGTHLAVDGPYADQLLRFEKGKDQTVIVSRHHRNPLIGQWTPIFQKAPPPPPIPPPPAAKPPPPLPPMDGTHVQSSVYLQDTSVIFVKANSIIKEYNKEMPDARVIGATHLRQVQQPVVHQTVRTVTFTIHFRRIALLLAIFFALTMGVMVYEIHAKLAVDLREPTFAGKMADVLSWPSYQTRSGLDWMKIALWNTTTNFMLDPIETALWPVYKLCSGVYALLRYPARGLLGVTQLILFNATENDKRGSVFATKRDPWFVVGEKAVLAYLNDTIKAYMEAHDTITVTFAPVLRVWVLAALLLPVCFSLKVRRLYAAPALTSAVLSQTAGMEISVAKSNAQQILRSSLVLPISGAETVLIQLSMPLIMDLLALQNRGFQ